MQDIPNVKGVLSYRGKKEVLVPDKDQDTDQIIKHIKLQHDLDKPEYDKIAEHFWQGNAKDTAQLLFDHQKKYVTYKEESPEEQTVKSPGAILHQGHGDCKHYALFITGVAEALKRQGHDIAAKYRFIADKPGMELHHVFSVISDSSGNSYWVDPVLNTFNQRPKFHKTKDAIMSGIGQISRVSGTNWDIDVPNVAGSDIGKRKKKHNNIFKKIAHGVEVNIKNAKKEIKKGADKVKHIALKVSLSAARGSFLGLVDLNAFNLAHRLHDTLYGSDTHKKDGLLNKWYDMGGEKNALMKAVHNGFRHYQKKHHVKNKVYGIGGIGFRPAMPEFMHEHHRMAQECRHHHNRPRGRADHGISGTVLDQIGLAPVAVPAMVALASGIIAAISKFIKPAPHDDKAMDEAKDDGTADLIKNTSDGIDVANGEQGEQAVKAMNKATQKGGMPLMEVSTGTDEEGAPQLTVHSVDHPYIKKAAKGDGNSADDSSSDDSSSDDDDTPGTGVQKSHGGKNADSGGGSGFNEIVDSAKEFVSNHKMLVGGTVLALGIGLVVSKTGLPKFKKGR